MQKFLFIDHHDNPRDDLATTELRRRGFDIHLVKPFAGDALPDPAQQWAGAMIYGGSMNVTDQEAHPYLLDEVRWIEQALRTELPLLGICLGAQLIAHTLGARVGFHPQGNCEFGYYEIHPVVENILPQSGWFEDSMHVTQAHYQQFDLPDGCHRLAKNDHFPNQAFRYEDRTYGLQFHPEVTETIFRRWQDADWAFYHEPGAQSREQQDAIIPTAADRQSEWFCQFLERLFPASASRANAA